MWYQGFMQGRGKIRVSDSAHFLSWLREGTPTWVVAFDNWMGYTCQLSMAATQCYVPKAFRRAVFNYAFNVLKRKRVYALVEAGNEAALRLDKWLGFREFHRAPGCTLDGKDIIMLELTAEEGLAKHVN